MASALELQRKQDISVVKYLENLLVGSPFITVVSEYKQSHELTVPSVAIETGNTDGETFELGNKNDLLVRQYIIDIFASNITQRNDYAYKIFNELKNPIPVYDYDEGFTSPSRLGTFLSLRRKIIPIKILPELVDEMHYRSQVRYTAVYDEYS